MLQLLREYVEGTTLVREFTKDGVTVSHTVRTPVEQETSGEVLPPLPTNPLIDLKDRLALAEKAIDDLIFGGAL